MPNLVNWINMLLNVPAIVILLGLVLCSRYNFSLTSVDLHKTWIQPVKDSLPQAVVFYKFKWAISTWFFDVFTLGWIHWFLLGQALWLETGSRCQWYPETSKPACLASCGVPGPGFQNIQLIFSLAAWHLFLWWAPLSGRWETWSSRVPGNIKKQKRPCRSMGYVTVLITSTSFRCLHSREPHRAGCSGFF